MRGLVFFLLAVTAFCDPFTMGRLHYSGGGDWYVGASTVPNWLSRLKKDLKMEIQEQEKIVRLSGDEVFGVDVLFATGHGKIDFSREEAYNLRSWLQAGGLLVINDSYGMDEWVRPALKKVFPELVLEPLASEHPVYRGFYRLDGLPKIHEHDGDPAQGFGLFYRGRLVVFYAASSDIGDGLEDEGVHSSDSPQIRDLAAQMATNLIWYHLNPQEGL